VRRILVLNRTLYSSTVISSQFILPKEFAKFINTEHHDCEILSYNILKGAHTYQQKAQLTSLPSNIFDLKILLKASELDLFCTGCSWKKKG
jgi:hypothetical protein